jgi:hypothetical protein
LVAEGREVTQKALKGIQKTQKWRFQIIFKIFRAFSVIFAFFALPPMRFALLPNHRRPSLG